MGARAIYCPANQYTSSGPNLDIVSITLSSEAPSCFNHVVSGTYTRNTAAEFSDWRVWSASTPITHDTYSIAYGNGMWRIFKGTVGEYVAVRAFTSSNYFIYWTNSYSVGGETKPINSHWWFDDGSYDYYQCGGPTTVYSTGEVLHPPWPFTLSPSGTSIFTEFCENCPANSFATTGDNILNDCLCDIGYQCLSCPYDCSQCPIGKFKNSVSWDSCLFCPNNMYAAIGSTQCSWCPENTYSTSQTGSANDCLDCPPGYFDQGSVREETSPNECTSCAEGKHLPDNATTCINCPAGKHRKSQYGICWSCSEASTGTYSLEGATACQDCPIGKHPDASASSCVNCSPGKYADTKISSASDCLECNYGKYSTSGVCVDCVDGTFANSRGLGICSSCSAGQFVEGGYWDYSGQYPGYWPGSCTSCPAGTSTDPSNNIYLCSVQCAAGKYAQGTPCTDCPSGTYNWFSGASECVSCSQNSFDYLTACQLCGGKGYKITVDSTLVLKNHRFDPVFGNEFFVHTWGQPGYYKGYWDYEAGLTWRLRNVYSSSFSTVKIKLGFMTADCYPHCNDYAVSSQEKTKVAWFIFYGDESNKLVHTFPRSTHTWINSRISGTQYFLDDYGGAPYFENINSAVTCQPCPPGTYLGSDAFSCTPCPAGTYSSASRATSVDTCLDCPVGTVNLETGASACTDCQVGKYAPNPTVVCEECPIGTYSTVARAVFDNCTSCEAGKFSVSAGSSNCLDCNFGTFQSNVGQSACLNCPTDTYANEFGLVGCRLCADCSSSANTSVVGCNAEEGPGICECLPDYVWTEDVTRCIHACDAEVPQGYYLEGSYLDQCLE